MVEGVSHSSGVVSTPDFGSQDPGFESLYKRNSAHDCMALHCTEPNIITLPSSLYDLNNVERDVTHQTIIILIVHELTLH